VREGKSISPLSVFTFRPAFILFIYLLIFIHSYISTGGLGQVVQYIGMEEGSHKYAVRLKMHGSGKPRKLKEENLVRSFRGFSSFEDVVMTGERSKWRRSNDRSQIRSFGH
jgi:hypothetical protein